MTSPLDSLPDALSQALAAKGFDRLTPVQDAMLDPALAGRDLLVSAQTGSGKTVAFGLALAETLLSDALLPPGAPLALVIAPTRELALQVRAELGWLYAQAGTALAQCVGGMDARTERRALERGAHIVVGTPGRLRDHVERGALDLSQLAAVVLDEADEMLDLGFREDLEFLLDAAPQDRRTLLFSATLSPGIVRLAETYQRDAARVATENARAAHADISYQALLVSAQDAENAIVNVLRFHEARNALVFCKTRAMVNHLTARFLNRGFPVVPLSGELAQDERARALQSLRDGRARVCVATDVAARGIDLPGLDLVIHADLPSNRETLLHRSGRTGRAGRKGVSVLIVPSSARRRTERLLSDAGVQAEWTGAPTAADVTARDTERLLSDPVMTAPESAEEQGLVTLLVERFTARELAAGVARHFFAARSAPEDIAATDVTPAPRTERAPRAEFARSFWVRLSVGAAQRAEPRWLLPMLCRVGNLTREDIGAIKIFTDETYAQILADAETRFLHALGPQMELENGISVTRSDAPDPDARGPRRPRPEADGKPVRQPRPKPDDRPRPPRAERTPSRPDAAAERPRPARFDGPRPATGPQDTPALSRPDTADRTARPSRPAAGPKLSEGRPSEARPYGKPASKPFGKPAGKPAGKPGAKPWQKPRGDAAQADRGQPAAPRPRFDPARASDPSAPLDRPGRPARPKPVGKPARGPGAGKGPGKPAGKGPGGSSRPFKPKRP